MQSKTRRLYKQKRESTKQGRGRGRGSGNADSAPARRASRTLLIPLSTLDAAIRRSPELPDRPTGTGTGAGAGTDRVTAERVLSVPVAPCFRMHYYRGNKSLEIVLTPAHSLQSSLNNSLPDVAVAIAHNLAPIVLGGDDPTRAMRTASLDIITIRLDKVGHFADFVAAILGDKSLARTIAVAIDAVASPAAAGESAALIAARAAAPALIASFQAVVDGLGPHHISITSAIANLSSVGIAAGLAEVGLLVGQAISAADAAAAAPPPPPPPPATLTGAGPDPVAAAIARAMGTVTPDPFEVEAKRRLGAASTHTPGRCRAWSRTARPWRPP